METQLTHLHPCPLPLPVRGGSARFRLGRAELILERGRGSFSLLWLDGRSARSWTLGLVDGGALSLSCRPPRWPLRIVLKDTLVLVPGSRVRGYVQAPLVPTIAWQHDGGPEAVVAELLPPLLSAEWDHGNGTCVQRWGSPLFSRLPPAGDQPAAVLPLIVRNPSTRMHSPESLPVSLRTDGLVPCRGHLVASPQRLSFAADGAITTAVRSRSLEVPP